MYHHSLLDLETSTDAHLFQDLSWKMMEDPDLLNLTLKESSSSMKPCHLVVFSEEESQSLVWLCWKVQVGILQITHMLNLTSMVKVKDVTL